MGKRNYGYTDKSGGYFLGEIDERDFDTGSPDRDRINRQAEADRSERDAKRFFGMTLEDLRGARLVSNTSGRPTSFLTDDNWQFEFWLRKLFITPYPENITRMGGAYTRFRNGNGAQITGYNGETNYSRYCAYINDVLRVIESGEHDYCYYIYQIEDLLKFHYDDLCTKYHKEGGYWEVWLSE